MPVAKMTYAALLVTIVSWASAFVGIRIGLTAFTPGALALFRYAVASLVMLFVFVRIPNKQVIRPNEFVMLFLLGVVGMGLYNITLNIGEVNVSAGIASFIASQIPVVTILLAHFALKEPFSHKAWSGLVISVAGVTLIAISKDAFQPGHQGVWFVIISTLCLGFYSAFQKPLLTRISSLQLTCYTIWFGTLSLLGFSHQMYHEIQLAPLSALLWVVYIGMVPTALAYVCWAFAMSKIPACRAASFLFFMPIIATFIGWLVIGELPSILSLVGGLIAIFGAVIIRRFA